MDKISKIVLAFILVALAFGIGYGNSRNKKEVTPVVVQTVEVKDEWKESYMSGCSEDGLHFAFCSCSYDYLENNYGKSGIIDISIEYSKTGILGPEMSAAASSCMSLY